MPDLEANRKVSVKLMESIPQLEEQLDTISCRRLEVIMTGAIRTQVRLNAANIKKTRTIILSILPHIAR